MNTRLSGSAIRRLSPEKRLSTSLFSLTVSKSSGAGAVACTVSKKVSPKAVVRNRVKRRMRAAVGELLPLPTGKALVFIAKRAAVDAEFETIKAEIAELVARTHGAK